MPLNSKDDVQESNSQAVQPAPSRERVEVHSADGAELMEVSEAAREGATMARLMAEQPESFGIATESGVDAGMANLQDRVDELEEEVEELRNVVGMLAAESGIDNIPVACDECGHELDVVGGGWGERKTVECENCGGVMTPGGMIRR